MGKTYKKIGDKFAKKKTINQEKKHTSKFFNSDEEDKVYTKKYKK